MGNVPSGPPPLLSVQAVTDDDWIEFHGGRLRVTEYHEVNEENAGLYRDIEQKHKEELERQKQTVQTVLQHVTGSSSQHKLDSGNFRVHRTDIGDSASLVFNQPPVQLPLPGTVAEAKRNSPEPGDETRNSAASPSTASSQAGTSMSALRAAENTGVAVSATANPIREKILSRPIHTPPAKLDRIDVNYAWEPDLARRRLLKLLTAVLAQRYVEAEIAHLGYQAMLQGAKQQLEPPQRILSMPSVDGSAMSYRPPALRAGTGRLTAANIKLPSQLKASEDN